MVKIHDISLDNFIKLVSDKKLFIWGAGTNSKKIVSECDIKKNLISVVDNDNELRGTVFAEDGLRVIKIIDVYSFISQVNLYGKANIVLLITPVFHIEDILKQLNAIAELEGLDCFIGELLYSFYEKQDVHYTCGELKIPKKIHYCWFGKNPIPKELQMCIDSWYNKCPDYEIIRWDENNYDITKNQYMREAYQCEKWGFVPDYARLDIIYNHGGIYLDTDVELLDRLDKFLTDDMFCGFSGELNISFGLGFGAIKNHGLIKELRDFYDDKCFKTSTGKLNLYQCTWYQHPVLKSYGFSLRNRYQNINQVAIYPSEVFSPLSLVGERNDFTEHTVSIHHGNGSWLSQKEKDNLKIFRTIINNLNE